MTKPIVKREYVQEFTKGHGTYTVREQHLARDLERAYTMIEELRDKPVMVTERQYDGYLSSSVRDYPAELTRILGET